MVGQRWFSGVDVVSVVVCAAAEECCAGMVEVQGVIMRIWKVFVECLVMHDCTCT